MNKKLIKLSIILIILIGICLIINCFIKVKQKNIYVDLNNLTYKKDDKKESIKIYDDLETFKTDFNNNNLPEIYITKFLFDGVDAYKPYDLDDFIEKGNDYEVSYLKTTVLNINTTGNIELTGNLIGMIGIDTNNLKGNVNVILNNVKIDTDSKKIPAIYVYNKDITYDKYKVTIKTKEGSKNYIEGGKLKKVSLVSIEELSNYESKYSDSTYTAYTNYYGVYTKDEIENILFASVEADNEDLKDNDPYYFYKAAGAISSDIDLYFEGKGYLEIISKNKEGVESKGNLSFIGKSGDYLIKADDDCLNTTIPSNVSTHNTLTIDVNKLYAIVNSDADEGDAIDSNGKLIINGGIVIAVAKTGQDSGIDSDKGIYINGGTVLSTGNMYDQVSNDSKQKFIVLSFNNSIENELITLLDSNDNVVFSYLTDRSFSKLVFSSPNLMEGTYSLYKNGEINGENEYNLYLSGTYTKGIQLAYSNSNIGFMGGNKGPGNMPDDSNRPEMPNGEMREMGERPELPNGEVPEMGEKPELSNGEVPEMPNNLDINFNSDEISNPTNKEFVISGISNLFNGIGEYVE